jgi:beta-lactamase regulating signal transducer with metallopeptidase domain/uncharacterized GH25 family protein
MNLLRAALESPLVNRIGWTLLHFLWEAAVVAALLAVILAILRRRSPAVRYLASCAGLVVLAALPVVTFLIVPARAIAVAKAEASNAVTSATPVVAKDRSTSGATSTSAKMGAPAPSAAFAPGTGAKPQAAMASARNHATTNAPAPLAKQNWFLIAGRRAVEWISRALPFAVLAWCIGVAALSIWNLGGWIAVRRLRALATRPAAVELCESAQRLARRMGITRTVRLLVSAIIDSPMVIGAIKPVILLPASLLCGLSPAQLESLLAHELAHVRRHDYLVNLLQGVVETVLFYHPAVWWVSRRIRVERENCCDDAVVSLTRDRTAYVRALAAVAESRAGRPSVGRLALAATGGSSLLPRVRRLLGLPDADAARSPRWLAGAVALLICIFATGTIVTRAQDKPDPKKDKDFDLPKPLVLDLEVVDKETGEALPGLTLSTRVDNQTRAWTTDERGHASIEYSEKTKYLGITAKPDGYVPTLLSWRSYTVKDPIPDTFKLPLEHGTRIGGIIQDESGKPVKDATVYVLIKRKGEDNNARISTQIFDYPCKTDAQGRWHCDVAPKEIDEPWIRLSHPDYLSDEMYGQTTKPPQDKLRDLSGIMVIKKGLAVAGRVVDQDGAPIAGAKVMQGRDRWGSHYPETKTDALGQFRFPQVRTGEMILTVTAKGHSPDLKHIQVDRPTTDVEFKLEPGHVVRGRVVDPEGKPLSKVMISTDTWRQCRSLQFRTDTDADGRFVWTEAPADEVLTAVLKQGFMDLRDYPLKAGDKELTITLRKPLRVTGTVVDAETNKPIEEFALFEGIDWANGSRQPIYWDKRNGHRGAHPSGTFEHMITFPRPGHAIRIEADGYLPSDSRVFKDDEGSVSLQFKMKKGQGLAGLVKTPDGKPLAGADVVLSIPGQNGGYIRNGVLDHNQDGTVAQSDAAGAFKFPPQTGKYMIVVLHDSGYAEAKQEAFEKSHEITVAPWGRITGVLRVGSKVKAGETMTVSHQDDAYEPDSPRVYHDLRVVTDENGQFAFNRVPPGRNYVSQEVRLNENMTTTSQSEMVEVKPGQTVELKLGGVGRPVIGRVNVPAEVAGKINWTTGNSSISTKVNVPGPKLPENWEDMTPGERNKWQTDWQKTPEFKAQQLAYQKVKHFSLKVNSDGTFRTEDVPAGTYLITIMAFKEGGGQRGPMEPMAIGNGEFTIPEMPGGRSDEPFDVGKIDVKVMRNPQPGDLAPEFSAKTLDDKPIKLSDYRGKHVAVYFWISMGWDLQAKKTNEILKKLYEQYSGGTEGKLEIIGLNLDQTPEAARKYVAKHAIPWPSAYLGDWSKTTVPSDWGLRTEGIFLVGPDGKLVARDLQGDAIRTTIEGALKK